MKNKLTKREKLVAAWKTRADYKGYDRTKGSSFNSWRAITNTIKGKNIGFPESWKNYDNFMRDVQGVWERGKVAARLNNKMPHSKDNTYWAEKGTEVLNRLVKLTYEGKTQTLIEWSRELNINYQGLRQRYFKHKDWCIKDILFGKSIHKRVTVQSPYKKRISRMCGAYKLRDKKKGLHSDIDTNWMLDFCNQPCIYCGDNNRVGLDRIDNNKGHTKNNVVPCCYECNCARMNNFTHEEMKEIGKAIRRIKCKRLQKKN